MDLQPLQTLVDNDNLTALVNVGATLRLADQPNAAIPFLERAVAISPDTFLARYYLAECHLAALHPDVAYDHFQAALNLRPDDSACLNNMMISSWMLQRTLQAYECARRNVADRPLNLALMSLLLGHYEQGWQLYETRDTPIDLAEQPKPEHRWTQSSGEPLVVYDEDQGFGDSLLFARFLMDAPVGSTFVTRPALVRLVGHSMPHLTVVAADDHVVTDGPWERLYSLPMRFGIDERSMWRGPYLHADLKVVSRWQKRMSKYPKPWIAVQYSGSVGHPFNALRNIDPSRLDFLSGQGTVFDLTMMAEPHRGFVKVDMVQDFADTAAILSCCDRVIAIDSSMINLAGAMGINATLLAPHAIDFRWQYEARSPWYPRVEITRQTTFNDWNIIDDLR